MTTAYECAAFFTKLGNGIAPSSAPTIKIVDSADNILVAALTATTALANLVGLYRHSYSGADGLKLYFVMTTTDLTVDASELGGEPSYDLATYALGAGSTATPITINDGVNPIDGVDVWATTDSAGLNVVARGSTNASGLITFYLDTGTTYYIWKQLAGYTFTNPETTVVS